MLSISSLILRSIASLNELPQPSSNVNSSFKSALLMPFSTASARKVLNGEMTNSSIRESFTDGKIISYASTTVPVVESLAPTGTDATRGRLRQHL